MCDRWVWIELAVYAAVYFGLQGDLACTTDTDYMDTAGNRSLHYGMPTARYP